ncbi:MAG: transposase [Deltaproteobacteria bacterium]|nr:transposase [Deltaproteobacteria bacterium]
MKTNSTITWVRLEVHKNTIAICWLRGDSQVQETREIPNDERAIRTVFKRLASEGVVRACYQVRPCGYPARRRLDQMGIACDVIAPAMIPRRPGDRIKTDSRDARRLARLYRAGELTPIRVPSEAEEVVRDLVRCREDPGASDSSSKRAPRSSADSAAPRDRASARVSPLETPPGWVPMSWPFHPGGRRRGWPRSRNRAPMGAMRKSRGWAKRPCWLLLAAVLLGAAGSCVVEDEEQTPKKHDHGTTSTSSASSSGTGGAAGSGGSGSSTSTSSGSSTSTSSGSSTSTSSGSSTSTSSSTSSGEGGAGGGPVAPESCDPYQPRLDPPTLLIGPTGLEKALLKLIDGAQSSLDIIMYQFAWKSICDATIAAKGRGVAVRVLLDGDESVNNTTRKQLQAAGIAVKDSPDKFTHAHAKVMIVDGKKAVVTSANFNQYSMYSERNYGVVDYAADDIDDLQAVFESDWSGAPLDLSCTRLIVSPENARPRLVALIEGAKKSLDLAVMYISDKQVKAAIKARAKAGVAVRVLLADPAWIADNVATAAELKAAGIATKYLKNWELHAKLVIADAVAFVGSENLSPTSLDKNREAGVLVTEPGPEAAIQSQFEKDWTAGVKP